MFESVYSIKNRKKIVEEPFVIPVASTDQQRDLRFKPIFESEIGFMLEFEQYASDYVDLLHYPVKFAVITSP